MPLFESHDLFFVPMMKFLSEDVDKSPGRLLILGNAPEEVTRFAEAGWIAESSGETSSLNGSYDDVLAPSFFHALSKEEAGSEVKRVVAHMEEGSHFAALFPPAWFPSKWKSKATHHHIEKGERLIVRHGNELFTFTLFSNREIYAIFKDLTPCQLVTLQNGMRRVIMKKV